MNITKIGNRVLFHSRQKELDRYYSDSNEMQDVVMKHLLTRAKEHTTKYLRGAKE